MDQSSTTRSNCPQIQGTRIRRETANIPAGSQMWKAHTALFQNFFQAMEKCRFFHDYNLIYFFFIVSPNSELLWKPLLLILMAIGTLVSFQKRKCPRISRASNGFQSGLYIKIFNNY